jgi:hypothetical protein
MELQVLTHVQEFSWNFDEIKTNVAGFAEKYHGLVVTEETLPDMEKAQKEIASVRVKIDDFRKEIKKRMNEPYEKFETQIKELQALIEAAETPLKTQIQHYEDIRVVKRENEIREYAKERAEVKGLREERFAQFIILPEWTRRSTKDTTYRKEVNKAIDLLIEQQKNADEAALLRKQKNDLIQRMCEVYSRGLKTPVTPEDVAHVTHDAALPDIPEIVMAECDKRREVENKAAIDSCDTNPDVGPSLPPVSVLPLPPINPALGGPPIHQDVYDVDLRLPGITIAQANEILAFFASRNITYQVLRQTTAGGELSDVS